MPELCESCLHKFHYQGVHCVYVDLIPWRELHISMNCSSLAYINSIIKECTVYVDLIPWRELHICLNCASLAYINSIIKECTVSM